MENPRGIVKECSLFRGKFLKTAQKNRRTLSGFLYASCCADGSIQITRVRFFLSAAT